MTSLGRLIFFDQPGTGASDLVTPGALPTLEQWVIGSGLEFEDRGAHELKGVPGEWCIFAVVKK